MSKSTMKWLYLTVPLAVGGVGTSVAVAMGFFLHPVPAVIAEEQTRPTGDITRSNDTGLVEQTETAAIYRLPDFALTGHYARPVQTPLAWDPSQAASPYPRIQDRPGHVARSHVRNPGVAIRSATVARKHERMVARLPPESMPQVVATVPVTDTLAYELNTRRRDVERCADRNMIVGGKAPTATGKIAVRWVVRPDGSADQVQVDENTVIDKKLSKCVVNTVNRWRFSPRTEGEAHLQSTFVFL